MKTDYEKQALDFLEKTKSTLEVTFNGFSDRFERGSYTMEFTFKLSRGSRSYGALFNSSINDMQEVIKAKYNDYKINPKCILFHDRLKETIREITNSDKLKQKFVATLKMHNLIPTAYDILTCIGINYCESIDDFISEYGYEIKSAKDFRDAEKTFAAVERESNALKMLYNDDELQLLSEIN